MDVTDIVDYALARIEKIAPSDADNADVRALALTYVVEVFGYVWGAYDWPWRRTTDSVTISANACSVALPEDWSDFGAFGLVKRTADGFRLEDKQGDPQYILRLQDLSTNRGVADCFAVFGTSATTPFTPLLQTRYLSANTAFTLWYNMVPPTLDESETNVDNLKRMPEQWHSQVLFPGIRALAAYGQGDARKRDFAMDPAFVAAIQRMAGVVMKRSQRRLWPSFFDR
jgi:hypothetical protein